MLFATGREIEARELLGRIESLKPQNGDLRLELSFYRLAHLAEVWPAELGVLKSLLINGVRSRGWNFSENINRVRQTGQPNVELLQAIADVIADKSSIETLDSGLASKKRT
jgi:hypothetical protein